MADRHKYLDTEGKHIVGGPLTDFLFSDAVIACTCPKCGSNPGFHCETPGGRRAWPPHNERVALPLPGGVSQ